MDVLDSLPDLDYITRGLRPKGLVDDQQVAISEANFCSTPLHEILREKGWRKDAFALEVTGQAYEAGSLGGVGVTRKQRWLRLKRCQKLVHSARGGEAPLLRLAAVSCGWEHLRSTRPSSCTTPNADNLFELHELYPALGNTEDIEASSGSCLGTSRPSISSPRV
mmetsp:Transcript_24575/g.80267  ORF Transcript_24575/g.80267 Transcript_24575/m.80267 type:complete len:165 (+) Transcript_24575:821-1315(+)